MKPALAHKSSLTLHLNFWGLFAIASGDYLRCRAGKAGASA
ncbi:MAG: hypothetical protein AB4426_34140 [Xenococcaceae cyanobacterium]